MYTSKHTYGRKSIKPKAKKLHPFVDLTAMVNLSFLLLMFFMLQSFIKKPTAMDLSLPQDACVDGSICCGGMEGWRNLTILIGENNKVVTYLGLVQCPVEKPKAFKSGSKELSNNIFEINKFVMQRVEVPEKQGLFVIIKPSRDCVFENLVETLDEMHINKVRGYIVDDQLNIEEQKLLEENKL